MAKNYRKDTPLHLAVNLNDIETVNNLIAKGANLNSKNYMKDTPLHLAVNNKKVDILMLLLEKGADIN